MPPNYAAHENKVPFSKDSTAICYAGSEKSALPMRITFHCFRHTYAVLQLANGTDIYTVSKMLTHKTYSHL